MSGLGSFIAGFGTGYFQRKDKEADRARQNRMDQIAIDQADRAKRDDDENQAFKADMKAAGAEQQVEQTARMVKDADGNEVAAQPVYKVGAAAMGTAQEAQAEAKNANAPESRLARQVGALNKHGKVNEAMALQASAKQGKLADLQLSDAERKHADELSNRAIDEEIQAAGGNTFAGLAAIGTKTNAGTMSGLEVKAVTSQDGKTVNMVGVDKEGKQTVLKSYSNDEKGALAARQDLMKVDPGVRVQWLHQRAMEAASNDRWTQEFDLQKTNTEFNQRIAKANLSIRQMEAGFAAVRAAREKATQDAEAKIPPAEKAKIASLDKEIDILNKAIIDAKAKGEWSEGNPGSQDLMKQLERAQDRHSAALAPFLSSRTNAAADPAGLREGPAQAVPLPAQPSQTKPVASPVATTPTVPVAQAAASGVPVPAKPAATVPPAAAAGLRVIQNNPQAAKNILPQVEQYKAAKQQLAAVTGSGDAKAITLYAGQLQAAQQALEAAAQKQFSGSAMDVLNAIYAQ